MPEIQSTVAPPYAPQSQAWKRLSDDGGIWEHRGKVALVGRGHTDIERRWDGKDFSKSLGSLSVLAALRCMEDAGVSPDQIDGVMSSPGAQSGGITIGSHWFPRPYFAPPYDSEDGLSRVTAEWLIKGLERDGTPLKNVKYICSTADTLFESIAQAAQAVGDGLCNTLLVLYPTGNLEGRYHLNPALEARGEAQWGNPWGWGMPVAYPFAEYCRKYGTSHDRMAPFIVNSRRNGLMFPWTYYSLHESTPLTVEDYLATRWVCKPLSLMDCDRPVHAAACYLVTTAERARDAKQKPVYVLSHSEDGPHTPRSTLETLEETEAWTDRMARKVWRGSGLSPKDIDVFNPYDGFALFTQYFLEALQWHGVKRGEAHDFYAGDISVEGSHPFLSSGGNIGNGRTRTAVVTDCMEQLQGRAGKRQVNVRCETAMFVGVLPARNSAVVFSNSLD